MAKVKVLPLPFPLPLPLLLLVCCLGGLARVDAQFYYEKNKVQTKNYDFRMIKTPHFDIYYYTGGEVLADFASRVAEAYYQRVSADMNTKRTDRIPLILYNSPNEFGQTNVVQDILEEGVGGFTEQFKNRVVVPFEGSYARFRKVLQHEITHVIEYDLFSGGKLAQLLSLTPDWQTPLWVSEGFAEYSSGSVEIENEVFMRDLILSDKLKSIDDLNYEDSYLCYREGEAIFRYIEDVYGRKKVGEFLHELKVRTDVNDALVKTLGISSKTFSEDFEQALRRKYWPQIAHDADFDKIGRKLTDHVADGSVYNTAPALSPSGSMVAFISDRNEYDDIYVISALDGKVLAHLVHGERSGGFESVHPYRGGITWAPDEKSIVMAAKAQGRDVLAQIAFPSGKVIRRLSFGLDGMYSPAFSPDGGRLAFVGLKDGASDIYVYDLKTRQLNRIMADIYEDRDPSFSPSGDTIVFVSDRPDSTPWRPADYAIFAWSKEAGITRLTPRSEYVANPTLLPAKDSGPDSSFIVHRSSLNGPLLAFVGADTSFDLCVYSLRDSNLVLRSSFLGGVYYPTFSRGGSRLIISYYQNLGWDIASIRDPLANLQSPKDTTLLISWDTTTYEKNEPEPEQVKPYQFKLTPDYVLGAAGYEGGTGLAGEFDVALSDILGNDQFYITGDLYGDIQNSDFSLSYWNLRNRMNYSVGIAQYFDYGYGWILSNDTFFGVPYVRRNLTLGTTAAYPFDEFTRLEFSPALVASQYQWCHFDTAGNLQGPDSANWLGAYQLGLAYVFDNTYWAAQNAPERGTRARIEAYGTYLPNLQYVSAYVDARNYLKFAKRYIFANRLQVMTSLGRDHDEFYVGGENVRGYDYQEFMYQPGTNMFVLNTELRSPFIDRVKIAFPLAFDVTDIRGVTFVDWGMSWNNNRAPVIYDTKNNRLQDLKLGIGYGFRFQVSYFDLMLDYGYPLSALSVDPSTGLERPRAGTWYFGIGTDF